MCSTLFIVRVGEKQLVAKTLRLLSLLTSVEVHSISSRTLVPKNALVHSLLYALNAYHTDSSSEAEGDGVVTNDSLPPLPPPVSLQYVQIQNSCCSILKHLMGEEESASKNDKENMALITALVEAGGLATTLKLYDHNLAVSGRPYYLQTLHPQQYQLPHPNQQKVLELLHSFSCNQKAIHFLFEEQRFDIIFGFLRSGLPSARDVITEEMWALLRYLPCSRGTSGESSWVQIEDFSYSTDDTIRGDGNANMPTPVRSWKDLQSNIKYREEGKVVQTSRAEHLAHLLLSSEHWLDLLLDDLTVTDRDGNESVNSSGENDSGFDNNSNNSSTTAAEVRSERATMSMICQLLDYNDRFLSTILLVQLAAPLPQHNKCQLLQEQRDDSSGWPQDQHWSLSSHPYTPPPRHREENDWDGPDHHIPHIKRHRHQQRKQTSNHSVGDKVKSTRSANAAAVYPPPSRTSALYALYRLTIYARHETAPSASFTLLWQEEVVHVLLQAFLNADDSLDLLGRQFAALALAELCLDDKIREHLLGVEAESLGGLNILEMIEWFLREEVYHER